MFFTVRDNWGQLWPRSYYDSIHASFRRTVRELLWNEQFGVWFDYDLRQERPRKQYYPSNLAPLWHIGNGCEHQAHQLF